MTAVQIKLLQVMNFKKKALIKMTKFSNVKVRVTDPSMHNEAHTNLANVIERLNDEHDDNEDFCYNSQKELSHDFNIMQTTNNWRTAFKIADKLSKATGEVLDVD